MNTCTVKSPSQSAMVSVMQRGKELGIPLVVSGCVPQGDKNAKELREVSLLGKSAVLLVSRCCGAQQHKVSYITFQPASIQAHAWQSRMPVLERHPDC